jgi:hypothetical protein
MILEWNTQLLPPGVLSVLYRLFLKEDGLTMFDDPRLQVSQQYAACCAVLSLVFYCTAVCIRSRWRLFLPSAALTF